MTYIIIFILKILENSLSTLRLIIVSNGKKIMGAILQFITVIVWIYTANSVLTNIKDNFYKVVAFSLGSLVGSYIGSIIEEKLALGNYLLIINCKKESIDNIIKELNNSTKITDNIFITTIKRKHKIQTIKKIKKHDRSAKTIACSAREYINPQD